MTTKYKPTKKHAQKLLEILSHGLVSGIGIQEPGKMCVEAAVCFAFGLPHGDNPPCVGSAVREFKIRLNDCNWPSNKARSDGMRALAVAQLGSDALDQTAFAKLMFLRGTKTLLPFVWRKEAENIASDTRAAMLAWCDRMEGVTTFDEARALLKSASAYAYAYASCAASASACAYTFACVAYASFAYTFASACAAYASASAYASAYHHELLKLTAQVGLDVLKEMKSPGCRWLNLLDA